MGALVGREQEIDHVVELLRLSDVDIVTITGPGGVGKTRLALEVADRVEADFPDGVIVVPLAPIGDPGLLLPTVARAVGVQHGAGDPQARLERELHGTATLLVLDNLEHVLEAAPRLAELVAACPGVKLAATSRTRLRLLAEREYALPPLDAPDCVRLFVDRARAVQPDLSTDESSLAAIEELCARLDGIPLAVELAAARAKLLSPEAMLARLGDRLQLLSGGARDLPARHQALRNTLDWSYDLLQEGERRLFARIAVFAGGFRLEAAEAICAADLDTLAALVDSSLVRADGERFDTLETVRDYAQERLAASGDEDEIRRAHAAYFVHLAEEAAPRILSGADQARWLDVLEAEHDNLRAAFRSSLDAGDSRTALRLGSALSGFWLERGYVSESRRWLGEALESGDDSDLQAAALRSAALLAHYDGDYEQAEKLSRRAIDLYSAARDRAGTAAAQEVLALALRTRGDFAQAEKLLERALEIFRELGNAEGVARTLDRLGIVVWFAGDDERANALVAESLERFRLLGDRARTGLALTDLGLIALSRGDTAAGQQLLQEGLGVSRELTDRWNIAKALLGLGDAARLDNDASAAAVLYDEGLTTAVEYGFPWLAAHLLERYAGLIAAAGPPEAAAQLFGAAAALRESIGAPMPLYFQRAYNADLGALGERLDDASLNRLVEQGRRLGPEEAAALARTALEPAQAAHEELTPREVEVLGLVAQGLTDAQVAKRLVVSIRTVHAHLRAIYRKLGVSSRSAATRYAVEHSLVQDR